MCKQANKSLSNNKQEPVPIKPEPIYDPLKTFLDVFLMYLSH